MAVEMRFQIGNAIERPAVCRQQFFKMLIFLAYRPIRSKETTKPVTQEP